MIGLLEDWTAFGDQFEEVMGATCLTRQAELENVPTRRRTGWATRCFSPFSTTPYCNIMASSFIGYVEDQLAYWNYTLISLQEANLFDFAFRCAVQGHPGRH